MSAAGRTRSPRRANGHRHPRPRLPDHVVQRVEVELLPWHEHELALGFGAGLALALTLFGHVLSEGLASVIDPVYLRPALYVTAFVLGVATMRGAGNSLRNAGSVTASNGRLIIAAFAGFAVMFSSALAFFSVFALLDHLTG